MTSSNQKFLQWFQEYFSHEFPTLSREYKNQVIEEILFNNQNYITKEEVMEFDACNQCGRCCEGQRCLDFDPDTRLCTRHDNPIDDLCKTYPWGGEEFGIAPLLLDCHYALSFFVYFFDNYFQKIIEGDNDAS